MREGTFTEKIIPKFIRDLDSTLLKVAKRLEPKKTPWAILQIILGRKKIRMSHNRGFQLEKKSNFAQDVSLDI